MTLFFFLVNENTLCNIHSYRYKQYGRPPQGNYFEPINLSTDRSFPLSMIPLGTYIKTELLLYLETALEENAANS